LGLVGLALEDAAVHQELAPLIVAVASEERVVEVEQGEAHGAPQSIPARCSEPALDADAEVLQPQQARGLARQALGAHRPVVGEPVAPEDREVALVVVVLAAVDRKAEAGALAERVRPLPALGRRKAHPQGLIRSEPEAVEFRRQPAAREARVDARLAALGQAQARLGVYRRDRGQRDDKGSTNESAEGHRSVLWVLPI